MKEVMWPLPADKTITIKRGMIPDNIRTQIEDESKAYDRSAHCGHFSGEYPSYHYESGARYGYSLAEQKIERKDKEIERLKELIKTN